MTKKIECDIAILGDGPAGLSLALALADSGLSVALLDTLPGPRPGSSPPERTLALSLGSTRILEHLGIKIRGTPISGIQVSQSGTPGTVHLDSALIDAPYLGIVLELEQLRDSLSEALHGRTNLVQIPFGPVQALQQHAHHVSVHGRDSELRARLLVAADGGQGGVAELAGLRRVSWDYNRFACIASVTPDRPPAGIAYEHFLPAGPLAFLPFSQERFSIVWSLRPSEAAQLDTLSDAAFLDRLNRLAPRKLGRIRATGPRAMLPLAFQRTLGKPDQRLALVGNSAQTLHPVAGQGFNLGLRDGVTLAAMIKAASERGEDIGGPVLLERYLASRQQDRSEIIGLTEGLNRLFSNAILPLKLARGLGLVAMDQVPALKRRLAARAAGLEIPAGSHTPALTPGSGHAPSSGELHAGL
ncbi:FAD-dependent monooxygenase [Thermithiobacillus plumbiphilus]|uniref:FAD-dependent monooxygenase n=1 Tax=Thermithiobacillus plumbiphilus TaxID=1729899 RepID=A0ABU9D9G6_9PROT